MGADGSRNGASQSNPKKGTYLRTLAVPFARAYAHPIFLPRLKGCAAKPAQPASGSIGRSRVRRDGTGRYESLGGDRS